MKIGAMVLSAIDGIGKHHRLMLIALLVDGMRI